MKKKKKNERLIEFVNWTLTPLTAQIEDLRSKTAPLFIGVTTLGKYDVTSLISKLETKRLNCYYWVLWQLLQFLWCCLVICFEYGFRISQIVPYKSCYTSPFFVLFGCKNPIMPTRKAEHFLKILTKITLEESLGSQPQAYTRVGYCFLT